MGAVFLIDGTRGNFVCYSCPDCGGSVVSPSGETEAQRVKVVTGVYRWSKSGTGGRERTEGT